MLKTQITPKSSKDQSYVEVQVLSWPKLKSKSSRDQAYPDLNQVKSSNQIKLKPKTIKNQAPLKYKLH